MNAWVFAGQGAEEPRMGLRHADEPAMKALLDHASAVVGHDVRRLLERGGPVLERTEVLQPVLTAVSLGVAAAARRRGERPDVVAGHSLGALIAWCAAGAVSAERAVELAAARARCMAGVPGGLLAVGPDAPLLDGAAVAAVNGPEQRVFAGPIDVLERARASHGGVFVGRQGPWHHPGMAAARDAFRRDLRGLERGPCDARFVGPDGVITDDDVPGHLAEQLASTVRWSDTLAALRAIGVTRVVAVGTSRVTLGLVRANGWAVATDAWI